MARIRAEDYDDKRRAILDEAAKLFAEHGFARTSISMISDACGGSKAWVYHYYQSKDAILFDLLDRHIRLLLETVRTAGRGIDDPEARLLALIKALLAAYRDADDTHKIQLNEMAVLAPAQQHELKEMERAIVAVFADNLLAINPALRRRPELVKPATMSLLGSLNWSYTWFRADGPMSGEEYGELVARIFVDGLKRLP